MECSICKTGTTERGYATVKLEKGDTIVLVKNVPADVCTNCGHYYLSSGISKIVLEKAQEAYQKGAELEK